MNGARNDLNNLDSQMGLIAKLKEIQEQLDSSSSGNENEDGGSESGVPSRQEPNESDPTNHHGNYASMP